jgi:phosphoglycolate phosphatase-like HAD superfamily hydrolase
MKYTSILFDFDGTLADTNGLVIGSWKHTFRQLRGIEQSEELIKKTFGEDAFMPILYLDSSYSRCLNRDGLYLLAASSDIKSTEDLSV